MRGASHGLQHPQQGGPAAGAKGKGKMENKRDWGKKERTQEAGEEEVQLQGS